MINSSDIKDLDEVVKKGCEEFIKRCKAAGYNIRVTSTYRDFEYQNMLYNKVPKVTNAKGGQSFHNFRVAFDICNNVKGDAYNISVLDAVSKIGKQMGFEWGGDYVGLVDKPHYQFTNGLTLNDFNKGATIPHTTKMKWEVENAAQILYNNKIITDIVYWKQAIKDINYLDILIINASKNIKQNTNNNITNVNVALDKMVLENVITSKDYWEQQMKIHNNLQYLFINISNQL